MVEVSIFEFWLVNRFSLLVVLWCICRNLWCLLGWGRLKCVGSRIGWGVGICVFCSCSRKGCISSRKVM